MIQTAQVESFTAVESEIRLLVDAHYDDLSLHKGEGIPLSPQWEIYRRRELAGELTFTSLRQDGKMIGYVIVFVCPGLHYSTCLTAITDIFFITPEARGGFGAFRLFRAAEKELRRRGCRVWFAGSKLHKPTGQLLEAIGMTPTEMTYCKWFGE